MIPFDFRLATRIVFGPGRLAQLGELATEMQVRRALIVSDQGVIEAGHTQRGIDLLNQTGIETKLFQEVQPNPTSDDVVRGVDVARQFSPDLIIGLGGGSSMDCAKGVNFVLTNGGRIQDYWGVGKARHPMLPMIAIPTTAGTGSETQSFALISDADSHAKMACGDKKASFRLAILDPELTRTQPAMVTALTGIDAIAHAVESYVTKQRNEVSQWFSHEAWRLLSRNFSRVLAEPNDLPARGAMQLGACLAGVAIENSMLGAAHALANPLTARYGIVHGQAVATMLPHVIQYNAKVCGERYGQLASEIMPKATAASDHDAIKALIDAIRGFMREAELALSLGEQGVQRDVLPQLAEQAAEQWTAGFNPRPVPADQLLDMYNAAFDRDV